MLRRLATAAAAMLGSSHFGNSMGDCSEAPAACDSATTDRRCSGAPARRCCCGCSPKRFSRQVDRAHWEYNARSDWPMSTAAVGRNVDPEPRSHEHMSDASKKAHGKYIARIPPNESMSARVDSQRLTVNPCNFRKTLYVPAVRSRDAADPQRTPPG